MIAIRQMDRSELGRIAEIDRTEHVTTGYVYEDGVLRAGRVDWRVPRWPLEGDSFSVQAHEEGIRPILEKGGVMLGAFNEEGLLVGFAVLRHRLAGLTAQLVALFVSKDYRRRGIATELASRVACLARDGGATELYVSATPSESAVGFYLSQGFRLAETVNKELFELEPEDIHLVRRLS